MLNRQLSIGFPYIASRFGGSNASSLVLAMTLKAQGHRVVVLAHGVGRMIDETVKSGIEIVQLPALFGTGRTQLDRARFGNYLALSTCFRAIRRLNLQIVHTNDLAMLRTWALPTALSRALLVAHWRSNYVKSLSVNFGLRLANAVISVSQYSKDALPRWAQGKTDVIYNPFGLFFSEEQRLSARKSLRARFALPDNAAILGVFGYHTVRKRTHILADVLHTLKFTADGRPVYGLACGERAEPHDKDLGKKIGQYSLGKRLLLPGFMRPVEEWMAGCDLVLAPAEREPFARNVLEAQGLGVPVIVSSDGGLREWIEDGVTGDLLDPYDTAAWIARVKLRLDDAEGSHEIAKRAQIKTRTRSPESHTQMIEGVYQRLLTKDVRQMKIVCMISFMNRGAGAQQALLRLSQQLSLRGHAVETWFLYRKAAIDPGSGVVRVLVPGPLTLLKALVLPVQLVYWFWRTKPDASISFLPFASTVGLLCAWLTGVKIRIASHRTAVTTYSRYMRIIDKALGTVGLYSGIVCVSTAVRESVRSYPERYRARVRVVHNGIAWAGSELSQANARLKFGLPQAGFIFAAAGRLSEQKNYAFLLRAFAATVSTERSYLVIAGDGDLRDTLQALTRRLRIEARTFFLGAVERQDIPDLLRAANAFLSPSLFEGQSNSVLEAMHEGLPIIVNDIPEQRETVVDSVSGDEAAVLAVTDDETSWIGAMQQLIGDERLRRKLSEAAQNMVNHRFSLNQMVEGFEHAITTTNLGDAKANA